MRVKLADKDRNYIFNEIVPQQTTLKNLAEELGVSARTVSDWKRGKFTIPFQSYSELLAILSIKESKVSAEFIDDWWSNKSAGTKGAAVRIQRYGQLGTTESRKKGGKRSFELRKNAEGDIFARTAIIEPQRGEELAEFIGVMIGDGNMTKYQVSISVSSLVDQDYCQYLTELISRIFGVTAKVTKRKTSNCLVIVVSSVSLVEFLSRNGVVIGDKIKQNLDIPTWITEDNEYAKSCIRGIFDTDGCIFEERHVIGQKTYSYMRWSLVSASVRLRETVRNVLIDLEFSPKIRNNRSVNLEKPDEVERYFRLIGTSNPKHYNRFVKFGGVG